MSDRALVYMYVLGCQNNDRKKDIQWRRNKKIAKEECTDPKCGAVLGAECRHGASNLPQAASAADRKPGLA